MLLNGTIQAGRSKVLRYCRKSVLSPALLNLLLRLLCPLNHPASGFLDCHLILFDKHPLSHWSTTEIHSFINNIVEVVFVLTGPAFPRSNAYSLMM